MAAPDGDPLVVDFAQCEEHVGIELIDADLVADEVPDEFGLGFFGPPVPGAAAPRWWSTGPDRRRLTYGRHLTQGVDRVVAWLWDHEVYGSTEHH